MQPRPPGVYSEFLVPMVVQKSSMAAVPPGIPT